MVDDLVTAGGVPSSGLVATASPVRQPGKQGPAGQPDPRTPADRYAAWSGVASALTGVPARALAAYAAAQARLQREQPGCRLDWSTLAGIGQVESANGDLGGGLLQSGRPFKEIIGISLDGSGDTAAVDDTDDGTLDHDSSADRAVGPLQFLPSTWDVWQADGDGDGRRDPQDIDDAALAAGRYLCAAGDLSTPEGWSRAVFSYNHSTAYVTAVLQAADQIAAASSP